MRKSVCFTDDLEWKVLLRHGYKREDKKGFLKKERVKKEHVSKQVRLQRNKSQKKRQKAISPISSLDEMGRSQPTGK